jgi:hypothetical protein
MGRLLNTTETVTMIAQLRVTESLVRSGRGGDIEPVHADALRDAADSLELTAFERMLETVVDGGGYRAGFETLRTTGDTLNGFTVVDMFEVEPDEMDVMFAIIFFAVAAGPTGRLYGWYFGLNIRGREHYYLLDDDVHVVAANTDPATLLANPWVPTNPHASELRERLES